MLCKMIKVRIVIQSSLEQGRILENHGLLKARCERGFILTVGFDSIKNQSVIFACRSPRELPALPKAACPWWLLAPTGSFSFTFVGLYQVLHYLGSIVQLSSQGSWSCFGEMTYCWSKG